MSMSKLDPLKEYDSVGDGQPVLGGHILRKMQQKYGTQATIHKWANNVNAKHAHPYIHLYKIIRLCKLLKTKAVSLDFEAECQIPAHLSEKKRKQLNRETTPSTDSKALGRPKASKSLKRAKHLRPSRLSRASRERSGLDTLISVTTTDAATSDASTSTSSVPDAKTGLSAFRYRPTPAVLRLSKMKRRIAIIDNRCDQLKKNFLWRQKKILAKNKNLQERIDAINAKVTACEEELKTFEDLEVDVALIKKKLFDNCFSAGVELSKIPMLVGFLTKTLKHSEESNAD